MKLKMDLENCYGINQLSGAFDFTKSDINDGIYSLYATKGTLNEKGLT